MGLNVTYTSLFREVARFLDAGRSSSDTDSTEETDIADVLASGQRMFYYPTLNLNPNNESESREIYRWSFLEKKQEIVTEAAINNYQLPDNFTSVISDFVYEDDSGRAPLALVGENRIRNLVSNEAKTGAPTYCAVAKRISSFTGVPIYEILLYPIPDQEYIITGGIEIEPELLSSSNPTPICGAIHAETLIEACLLAAEQKMRPEQQPVHAAKFELLLRKSVEADRRITDDGGELWPDDLNDGTTDRLEINKFYLAGIVGRFLRFGAHPKAWKHNQRAEVDDLIRTGLREFYNPQPLPKPNQRPRSHTWSFLSPQYILTLEAEKYTYLMPADFGSPRGEISYAPNTGQCYPKIMRTNVERVQDMLQYSTDAGYAPTCAAFRPVIVANGLGTRWEMLLAPPPPGGDQLVIPYNINPYDMVQDESLPLGGQPHAQTLIEACLAAAEAAHPDLGNVHTQKFQARLYTSISYDEQAQTASTVGFSLDRSMGIPDGTYHDQWYLYDNHVTEYDNT